MRNKIIISIVAFCLMAGISFADSAVIARRISPAPGTMTAEFKDAKKVIIHPSGVVSECTVKQQQDHKAQLIKERDRIDAMIADIDSDVVSCSASLIKIEE